ncbi:uncharacterized protein [Thunnus thynnus]|uniref:uncharacterized protein n=1 Tax=Thunnus thynnus TaxID=8237 RepID=UPI0035287843
MCSRCPDCCLNNLRDTGGGDDDEDDDDLCPLCQSSSSCDDFKHHRCLFHIISICRKYEHTAEGVFCPGVSQVQPPRQKWLLMICGLLFLLLFTFLMAAVSREEHDAQDYDADVVLPSKALWLLGSLLFWTIWLLLHLLQMFLRLIKVLLWFINIFASPLCHCLSFILSCVLLLLHYTCDAVFFATTSPVYIYGMLLSVGFSLLIFTR